LFRNVALGLAVMKIRSAVPDTPAVPVQLSIVKVPAV
jgi:hypothetical protein